MRCKREGCGEADPGRSKGQAGMPPAPGLLTLNPTLFLRPPTQCLQSKCLLWAVLPLGHQALSNSDTVPALL